MIIDLRSDTVTKPTPGMLDAMMSAAVGDDVLDGDPSVKELEKKCAHLLGMQAAVFCPSGTMANQIGIRLLTQPYDEIICYEGAHIYQYEGGGLAGNLQVNTKLVLGDRGRITLQEIASNIHDHSDPHLSRTSLVALENTVLSEAGSFYTIKQVREIEALARSKGLSLHLDGARLFNAIVASGDRPDEYGKYFDTISVCLSKGLGAPVGSVLLCSKENEQKAVRARKAFGGGMRQAGYLAAAGSYALDNHIERLRDDHKRAKTIGQTLSEQHWVASVRPVDTNIIIFEVKKEFSAEQVIQKWMQDGIKTLQWSHREVRLATHLDIDDEMMEKVIHTAKKLF